MRRIAPFVMLVLVLASACAPYRAGEVLPKGRTFPGLQQLANGPLDVIAIHGMCTHDSAWVEESGRQMSAHLGLEYQPPKQYWDNVGDLEIWKNELRRPGGQIAVTQYAIVWSKLTAKQKTALCEDSGMKTKSCAEHGDRRQAKLNNFMKSNLMNDCLADAIIYTGAARKTISSSVRQALEIIGRDRQQQHPAAIISESLGSKIIVDAVSGNGQDPAAAARRAIAGTRVIYMAANQIPLLDLGNDTLSAGFGATGLLDALRQAIISVDGLTDMSAVQGVAFTDPNDLLSYELDTTQTRDANVRITIATVVLGVLANPWKAHTGYLEKKQVWRYIACGSAAKCP